MIGMLNCRPGLPLPDPIKAFMDDSGEAGVILVSFGSVLQASQMSDSLRLMLMNVLGGLKQRVLWKWESHEMKDKPDNVMLSKWLPQQDILAHSKLRLFITHGGQSSAQEALCHKKPVVIVYNFLCSSDSISYTATRPRVFLRRIRQRRLRSRWPLQTCTAPSFLCAKEAKNPHFHRRSSLRRVSATKNLGGAWSLIRANK